MNNSIKDQLAAIKGAIPGKTQAKLSVSPKKTAKSAAPITREIKPDSPKSDEKMPSTRLDQTSQAKIAAQKIRSNKSRDLAIAGVNALKQAFPELFDDKNVRPLSVGIREQINAVRAEKLPGVSTKRLRLALHRWFKSQRYLKALTKEGAQRINFDASPGEMVTPAHAQYAERILSERKRKTQKPDAQPIA